MMFKRYTRVKMGGTVVEVLDTETGETCNKFIPLYEDDLTGVDLDRVYRELETKLKERIANSEAFKETD